MIVNSPRVLQAGAVVIQRLRFRFRRLQEAKHLSHLEQIDLLRRTFKATGWPVAYGGGRRPKMKVSFGPAISVGYGSEAEYCDLCLRARLNPGEAMEKLAHHLPAGFECLQVKSVPVFFPSLEELINLAVYEIQDFPDRLDEAALEGGLERLRQASSFMVKKKRGDDLISIDAKPLIRALGTAERKVHLELRLGPKRTLKPEKILETLFHLTVEETNALTICRIMLYGEKPNGDVIGP